MIMNYLLDGHQIEYTIKTFIRQFRSANTETISAFLKIIKGLKTRCPTKTKWPRKVKLVVPMVQKEINKLIISNALANITRCLIG